MADARHILIDDVWPDDYEDLELIATVEKIMIEWNDLNGIKHSQEDLFYKKDALLYDYCKIEALELAHLFFDAADNANLIGNNKEEELCKKEGFKILDIFGIKGIKNKNDIVQKYKQIIQKINEDINEEIKDNINHKNIDFYDLVIPIELYFKIEINENITCSKFMWYINKIKKMSK